MSRRATWDIIGRANPRQGTRRSGVHHVAEKQRVECAQTVPAKSGPTAKFRTSETGQPLYVDVLGHG